MKVLPRTEFGNPILHAKAKSLKKSEINSSKIRELISNMRHTLMSGKLGVGLAAPQVNESLALAVIAIHPTAHRPKVKDLEQVIINPKITKTFGEKKSMWEGCISAGKSGLFARVERFNKIELKFYDEQAKLQTKTFSGLAAQVVQHEVDHLNGILFMQHVSDPKTYMTMREYKKRIVAKRKKQPAKIKS